MNSSSCVCEQQRRSRKKGEELLRICGLAPLVPPRFLEFQLSEVSNNGFRRAHSNVRSLSSATERRATEPAQMKPSQRCFASRNILQCISKKFRRSHLFLKDRRQTNMPQSDRDLLKALETTTAMKRRKCHATQGSLVVRAARLQNETAPEKFLV